MTDLPSPWLRSTQWLADHLDAPDIVIIDASFYLPNMGRDAEAEYLAGHVPGAIRFDVDTVKDDRNPLPHMLPQPHVFASHMRRMGIGDGNTIAIYDGHGLFAAPRVWWMFRIFGAERVFIIDGGLPKWKAEGRALEEGKPQRRPGHFTVRFDSGSVRDIDDVKSALKTGSHQIIDARSAERFAGSAPEPRTGLASGHMPGSLNVPFADLLRDGRLKPVEELKVIFETAGIDWSRPIITSCGSGVSAAVLGLALDAVGHRNWGLYDGSWSEWGSTPDAPVERG